MEEYRHCPELEKKLRERGYYVSPNYGLIMKNENDEFAIADIRYSERKVVLPYWNEVETEEVKNLRKVLGKEEVRDSLQGAD